MSSQYFVLFVDKKARMVVHPRLALIFAGWGRVYQPFLFLNSFMKPARASTAGSWLGVV